MKVSTVVPVFNEGSAIENNLRQIHETLSSIEGFEIELIVVDDGSTDDTVSGVLGLCQKLENLQLISFSRNFGKESAIYAGLTHSTGDAVIVMDSDLQHPPELTERMVNIWVGGVEVVEACKASRGKESLITRLIVKSFFILFRYLTKLDIGDKSDFKLLDRVVVDAYCDLPERKRFFRGIIPWLGFSSKKILFDVPEREYGNSSWSKPKLLRYSINALTSFTSTPLHLISLVSILFFTSSLFVGGLALYEKFRGTAVDGFTTVILLILITGSLVMFGLGQLGLYIEQIFDEVKRRPHYVINRKKSHYTNSPREKPM